MGEQCVDDVPAGLRFPTAQLGLDHSRQVTSEHVGLVRLIEFLNVGIQPMACAEPTLQIFGDQTFEQPLKEGRLLTSAVDHVGSLSEEGDRGVQCVGLSIAVTTIAGSRRLGAFLRQL